jgi:hypothetical protein
MAYKYKNSLNYIYLRMSEVRKLEHLAISEDVFNTEGLMLILNKQYKTKDGKRMLFKYLDMQEFDSVMDRKEYILSYLNSSPYKDLEGLVIPDSEIFVDGDLAGFAMPLIEHHKNVGHLLHSHHVPFHEKKKLLKELGALIDSVNRIDAEHELFFGDLNEYNFILDEEEKMKAIDLDSCHVSNLDGVEPPDMAYYLLKNPNLWTLPNKYKKNFIGILIPNKDSDLYSYLMVVLDTIANHNMFKEDMDTYFAYLEYLHGLGVPSELIDMFWNIYTPKTNENPRLMIDTLDDHLVYHSSFNHFQKKKEMK